MTGERSAPVPVVWRWQPSALARRLAAVATAGLLVAVLSRRPEALLLAVPALLALAASARGAEPGSVSVAVAVSPYRCFEGESVRLKVIVTTEQPLGELAVEVVLPPGMATEDALTAVALDAARVELEVTVVPGRWGRWRLGEVRVSGRSGQRLRASTGGRTAPAELAVFPRPAAAPAIVAPRTLPYGAGDHASRQPESGIEFAGIRRYVPGDAARRINWPVSTRRGGLHVTTYAAERPVDVVVLVDAFSDVGPAGDSSLDIAVRGTAGLAQAYLRQRDRVGFVVLGGSLRWLRPGVGERQFYRVVEDVLTVRRDASYLDPDVTRVPRAVLPPAALVVAFSPLLDPRALEALRELRERGVVLVVVDVLNTEPPDIGPGPMARLALQIWRLEREALQVTFDQLGMPIVPWDGVAVLDLAAAGVSDTVRLPAAGGVR